LLCILRKNDELYLSFSLIQLANDVANGAVATDDPRCSDVGLSILRDFGGSAVDAAVAVVLCLQVVNPAGSTLGGGGFMLIHSNPNLEGRTVDFIDKRSPYRAAKTRKASNKVTEVIDCREVAPAAATATMFQGLSPDATWYVSLSCYRVPHLLNTKSIHVYLLKGMVDSQSVYQDN